MEKSNGKKRKFKRTNMTVSKKSKRYRLSRSVSNRCFVKTVKKHHTELSSASDSETEYQSYNKMELHRRVSTSDKIVDCKPDITDKSVNCKPENSDKSTQNKISHRNFCVQSNMPV